MQFAVIYFLNIPLRNILQLRYSNSVNTTGTEIKNKKIWSHYLQVEILSA